MNGTSWKEIMLGTLAGLSILTSPAMGSVGSMTEEPAVQTDNRGTGSLNGGSGSLNREPNEGNHRSRDGRGRLVIAQASDDIRQEERRADRREDRRLERREDRQVDRREDHRSNAGARHALGLRAPAAGAGRFSACGHRPSNRASGCSSVFTFPSD